MKLKIDKNKCIGCGACASICSELFEIDNDGKAETKKSTINEEEKKCAQEAADSCPVQAIEIEE